MTQRDPGPIPTPAFSPSFRAGRLLFVSGQLPLNGMSYEPRPIDDETRMCIDRLAAILSDSGAGLTDVVRCGVYLADLRDFAAMDATYRDCFGGHLPARTTVGAELAFGAKVEIDCIAYAPTDRE